MVKLKLELFSQHLLYQQRTKLIRGIIKTQRQELLRAMWTKQTSHALWCLSGTRLSVLSDQVNSDKIYWQKNLDGTFSQIYSEKKAVGHMISTKAVGSDERADITHLYKHKEGTGKHIVLCSAVLAQIDAPESDRIIFTLPRMILKMWLLNVLLLHRSYCCM